MHDTQALFLIAVIAVMTMLLRFLPFLIFGGKRKVPDYVLYLGKKLPYAIIGMLIVYCLKDVSVEMTASWLPSLIGVAAVAGLHLWRRNTLLSIVGGTVLYMVLV
ncbi:MAG: AzlD domain-containing protein, partial [Lachnospiraceae bacterium]|nr:AzlD domain-containing protein [Lachnospiraceae bacterium]